MKLVFVIFLFACVLRFLYFPTNVYFGFDQARDAFESTNIYQNLDLKIIGPSTAREGVFHGPLWWYLIGPLYLISKGDPAFVAAVILVLNALGVFLVYKISSILFNHKTGLIAALLFAVSFEQTQYAMYFGNPAPAVLTVMLFYFGLTLAIFKNRWYGIPLSLFGLGLSIQFEFALIYLSVIFVLVILLFRKQFFLLLNLKTILISVICFGISLSTFIVAELMYGFRTTKILLGLEGSEGGFTFDLKYNFSIYLVKIQTLVEHNFFSFNAIIALATLPILAILAFKLANAEERKKVLFLIIWGLSSSVLYLFGAPNLYYFNIGVFIGFLILVSHLLDKGYEKSKLMFWILLLVVLVSNLSLIRKNNPTGITNDIYVQEGMLLSREKELMDYVYQNSSSLPIVVSASTMPLKINTTWAYLFNWYGKQKYGTIPYWAGPSALGFPGDLPFWKSQEKVYAFYSIVEPKRGVGEGHISAFLEDQKQYGRVLEEKVWGDKWYNQLLVQKRK